MRPGVREGTCPDCGGAALFGDGIGACQSAPCWWASRDPETDGDTIYVDASAEAGGDGSNESPVTVIQEGLDAAPFDGLAKADRHHPQDVVDRLGFELSGLARKRR